MPQQSNTKHTCPKATILAMIAAIVCCISSDISKREHKNTNKNDCKYNNKPQKSAAHNPTAISKANRLCLLFIVAFILLVITAKVCSVMQSEAKNTRIRASELKKHSNQTHKHTTHLHVHTPRSQRLFHAARCPSCFTIGGLE